MKRTALTLLLLCLLAGNRLAADDWIGLEQQSPLSASADLAIEDNGDMNGGVNLELALGDRVRLSGDYHVYELSDEDEDLLNLALVTALWLELTELIDVEINYFFEGDIDELEKDSLGLALGFNHGNWNLRIEASDGELRLFTRDDLRDVRIPAIPERIDTDLVGYGLRLGWQQYNWHWQVFHQRYDYDRDLSPLASSNFAQFIVKSSALAQSSLLISKYTGLGAGYSDFEDDYSFLLLQDQSAIDDMHTDTLVLSWQHWAGRHVGYLLDASFPESEAAGLMLGLRWVM